jgi:putative RNA 2'-phosphotransferase
MLPALEPAADIVNRLAGEAVAFDHLSKDTETPRKVGARRGQPVILRVGAGKMHAAGFRFFLSANGVWLTDSVPAAFLTRL